MSMTEAVLRPFSPEADAAGSERESAKIISDEWREFAAQMSAHTGKEAGIKSVGITMEQAIDALRVAVEEDLCSFVELDHR
jgi:hypothetical protein